MPPIASLSATASADVSMLPWELIAKIALAVLGVVVP